MKIYAIIPARSGSKGVPDKNIRLLAGHPVIAYSIAAAKEVDLIDRIIVCTDSQEYADIAIEYGAEAPFLRPKELSGDRSSDYDYLKQVLDWCKANEGTLPDLLVHLRPTTPLRDPRYIYKAIDLIMQTPQATALRSAHEMSETACKCFLMREGLLTTFGTESYDLEETNVPRQQLPTTYHGNGYVDILKTQSIVKHKKIHGNHVLGFITPVTAEIDTEDDFRYIQFQASDDSSILTGLRLT